jgi:hypothetical protein
MERKLSLLRPEKVNEIRWRVKEAENIDNAIYTALEIHDMPLTFNDIRSLMPAEFENPKKITVALNRLIRERKVQRVIVIMPEGPVKAYATITDTQILIGIPVWLFRQWGYEVSMGFAKENQRKHYDLFEPKCDYLLIHINRSKAPNNPEKGEA